MFQFKKISLHLLNLGVPPGSQEGEERITKLTQRMKTAIGYIVKHDRLKLRVFQFKKISLHLLNLGVPPGSQEGEERITKLTQNMKTAIG